MPDQTAIAAMQDHSRLATLRSGYDAYLQDIRKFVRPESPDLYNDRGVRTQIDGPKVDCYDSTAMWSAEQLAAGYAGFLTPSNDRWADVVLESDDKDATREERLWLDKVSDILYKMWNNPNARFVSSMQESYSDLASFGTSILYEDWNPITRSLRFRAFSPVDCWLRESNDGIIDTCHRSTMFTTRQLYQQFDEKVLNKIEVVQKDREKNERTFEVIHIVRPRSDGDQLRVKKPYTSLYVLKTTNDTLRIGGYDYFPYHVGREKVVTGTVYGQSCAFTMLPAIKMLNAMMKTVIKAANKAIDPPLMVPSDGFMVPLNGDPGALLWYDPAVMTVDSVQQLNMAHRFDISDQLIADIRDQITRGFKVDWLIRNKKNERQTATEIMDDRDEMLRQLAPTLGRLESEQIASIVKCSYNLAKDNRMLPPAPPSLLNKKLDVRFQSPAARAQYGARGADVQRYITELTPMFNIWPSMAQGINEDELGKYLAKIRNLPASLLRDEEEVAAIREGEQAQQQQQMMMEAAPGAAGALKDVAQAGQMMGGMM